MLEREGSGAVCPLEWSLSLSMVFAAVKGPGDLLPVSPLQGRTGGNVGVPPITQVMVLVQETPTSPSQDKYDLLPNLLPGVPHPSNTSVSCYRLVFSRDSSRFPHLFQHLSALGRGIASVIQNTSVILGLVRGAQVAEEEGVSMPIFLHEVTVPFHGPSNCLGGSHLWLPSPSPMCLTAVWRRMVSIGGHWWALVGTGGFPGGEQECSGEFWSSVLGQVLPSPCPGSLPAVLGPVPEDKIWPRCC